MDGALADVCRAAGLEDPGEPLRWLAWRHPALQDYEPAALDGRGPPALPPPLPQCVVALVVHGCSLVDVPRSAADLFVDMLHPSGCRSIVITGGVGRETGLLWDEVAARGMTHLFGAPQAWNGQPQSVDLPTQGVRGKPVLEGFSHDMPEAHIRAHCAEADVFLEIFVARCKERGFEAIDFGGNPLAQSDAACNPKGANQDAVRSFIYLETASTHTGSNVEFTASTLRKLGFEPSTDRLAVIQHPQLQKRACLTWAKQMGRAPDSILGWTLEPIPAKTRRSTAEMLHYALGELQRLPLYSRPDKGFVDLPGDFPSHLVTSLEAADFRLRKAPLHLP